MIDWTIAQRVAALIAGPPLGGRLPGDITERAADYRARVSAYTQLQPAQPLPPPEGVTRSEWIAANHTSMRPLLEPLAERMSSGGGPLAGPMRTVSGALLGAQVGALTGLLSQRVLGQYDLVLIDAAVPSRLLLVVPNLAEAAVKLEVDENDLISWVTVHEVTHAVQFSAVPWLRGHLGGLVSELLEGMEVRMDVASLLRRPSSEDLRGLVEAARSGDLLRIVLGPERQRIVDRIQAAMSLVEGHAEHVMDAVGADLLPALPTLRAALDRRRATRSPAWRLLERLLGLELKMRQYEVGRSFCDAVVAQGGISALNRAWGAPEALPTLGELQDPSSWMARTHVPAITSSGA